MDHHKILRSLIDLGGSGTEEQVLDDRRLLNQPNNVARVEHSLPRMVDEGLMTVAGEVYTITEAGRAYVTPKH